jgi:cytochrome c biogenesis protein
MSSLEETGTVTPINLSPVKVNSKASLVSDFLKLLCSVRFGIVLLILLALACLVGMLIMQENVEGFGNYYVSLTPAQRLVYGKLGFFDIYQSWYFSTLLALLSLNIILASIDRFPKTQLFLSKPLLTVPLRWLRDQKQTDSFITQGSKEEVIDEIREACKKAGWRKTKVSEKGGRTFVFAESGVWNRFAYLAVHVGLLTIFVGGFLTSQLGQTGNMPLTPGQTSNEISETTFDLNQVNEVTKRVPFEVICTDIQQKLIRKDGPITAGNTIDWVTRFVIKDETGSHEGFVQMNQPFDYRGYRFFQASFTAIGRARNITVRVNPANGGAPQEITIPRDGTTALPDGTKVEFAEFRGNFSIGQEDLNEDTTGYPNPGAVLRVTSPDGKAQKAYAFGQQMANLPVAKNPVAGYTYQLIDFEKASEQHILSVQRDPGSTVVYVGFILLFLTLVSVFFFSHQRVWAALEETSENNFNIVLGGNTNRNQNGFAEKFSRFVRDLRGQNKEVQTL